MDYAHEHGRMTNKCPQSESPVGALKNEAARQRWELFHRAISHAKQSNNNAMEEAESASSETKQAGPMLSIAR